MQDVSYIRMESALHVAIRESHSLKALYDKISVLKNQSEIYDFLKLQNDEKCTALHLFVECLPDLKENDGIDDTTEQKIVETLSKGIIDAQDLNGKTPLHIIPYKYNQIGLIKSILNCKPDLSVCDDNGDPPFLSLILDSYIYEKFCNTVLEDSFVINVESPRQLMEIFPSWAVFLPNSKTNKNILHFLAEDALTYIDSGYIDVIEEVISVFLSSEDAKSALLVQSNDGEIPLHSLIMCFTTKSVAVFVETFEPDFLKLNRRILENVLSCVISGEINANQQDASRKTILHYLVESNVTMKTQVHETLSTPDMEVVKASVQDDIECFCDTVLCLVQTLVDKNADVHIKDMEGDSVQELADNLDDDDLIKSLHKKGEELTFRIRNEMYLEELSDLQSGRSMRQIKYYRFHEDKLAEGSMGEVYVAVNENDHRELALKRVKKDLKDSQVRSEIRALCSLSQKDAPNIVNYYELVENENFYFVALELMDGDLKRFHSEAWTIRAL